MEIELKKNDVAVESVETGRIKVSPNALRSRIRELISAFMTRPVPVSPTDADIMNDYLSRNRPEFAKCNHVLLDLKEELSKAPKKSHRRLKGLIGENEARRIEIISETGSDDAFLRFRSDRRASFNEELARYNEQASVIHDLRPYLGMPQLPPIECESLSAEVILSLLAGVGVKTPVKGQMILMQDENVHCRPQFFPRSALRKGLSASLCGKDKAVGVPFSPSETMGVEALAIGAFERRGKIFFRMDGGRPIAQADWVDVDRYLPFSCRSISVPLLPSISPLPSGFDFATVFGGDAWSMIREEVLDRHASTCMICGSGTSVEVHPRWRFREPLAEMHGPGVQILEGFLTLCGPCTDTLRPSLSSLLARTRDGFVLRVSKERSAWLRVTNRWEDVRHRDYVSDAYLLAIEAYRRRARRSWIVDISLQRSAFLVLQREFSMDSSGWIWPIAGPPFKVVGAPFYEGDDRTRTFFAKPSIFDVPWGAKMSTVSHLLGEFDLAAAGSKGEGFNEEFPKIDVPILSGELEQKIEEASEESVEVLKVDLGALPSSQPSSPASDLPWDKPAEDKPTEDAASGESGYEFDDDDDEDEDYSSGTDYHEKFVS